MATTKEKKTAKKKQAADKQTWYGVRSWYYDSGTVYKRAFEDTRERENLPLNYFVRGETSDIYVEYFETKEARDRALNAGRTSAEEIEARFAGTYPTANGKEECRYYRVLQSNAKKLKKRAAKDRREFYVRARK